MQIKEILTGLNFAELDRRTFMLFLLMTGRKKQLSLVLMDIKFLLMVHTLCTRRKILLELLNLIQKIQRVKH